MSAEGQIIPDDIMKAAQGALDRMPDRSDAMDYGEFWARVEYEVVSSILAERERCAAVAVAEYEKRFENVDGYPFPRVHDFIVVARAIEKGIRDGSAVAPKAEG